MHRAIYQNPTFRLGRKFDLNACVGYNGFPNIHTYQFGYYKAAITLIESVKKSSYNADALVYPIVFSARHAIELFLKKQLYSLRDINKEAEGKQFESKLESIHSIKELWDEFKELTKIDTRYEPYIKDLEDYIVDFYEVDDTGQTFRYPFDTEETRHLTDLGCINIEVFGDRFNEMYKIVEELVQLTGLLRYEYKEGTFIKDLSREQIREIAMQLPQRDNWDSDEFSTIKEEILENFSISSRTFSKALNLIQKHMEFASYIGMEIPLEELEHDALKKFIDLFKEYRKKFKTDDFVDVINNFPNAVCSQLSVKNIHALAALFDIAYFDLYPEAYERILEEKRERDVFDLVFDDISVRRGIILERVQMALSWLGQKTLLKAFD